MTEEKDPMELRREMQERVIEAVEIWDRMSDEERAAAIDRDSNLREQVWFCSVPETFEHAQFMIEKRGEAVMSEETSERIGQELKDRAAADCRRITIVRKDGYVIYYGKNIAQ